MRIGAPPIHLSLGPAVFENHFPRTLKHGDGQTNRAFETGSRLRRRFSDCAGTKLSRASRTPAHNAPAWSQERRTPFRETYFPSVDCAQTAVRPHPFPDVLEYYMFHRTEVHHT